MLEYYPPAGFHFHVQFLNPQFVAIDSMFQSVSGLSSDVETMDVVEGGVNNYKHKLPVSTRYPNLVLKRGLLPDSFLLKWCRDAMENFEFSPLDLMVILLNQQMAPLKAWSIKGAFPVKWDVSEFNAQESSIVVESFELSYKYYTTDVQKLPI